MEVKKIVEGMTAPQVAQVIDDNFKAQNAILEEDIAKQNNVIGVSEYKDFSEAEAVNVGDVRKYDGLLYECVEATTGAFDASKWKKSSFKAETEKKLSELGSKVFNNSIEGKGSTYSRSDIKGLIPNHTYKMRFDLNHWKYDSIDAAEGMFLSIYEVKNDGSEEGIIAIAKGHVQTLNAPIEFVLSEDASGVILVGGRAEVGSNINFIIEDVTNLKELDYKLEDVASYSFNNAILGNGTTYSKVTIKGLIPNRSYKINVNLDAWDYQSVNSSDTFFSIYAIINDGSERALLRVPKESVPTLAKPIEIIMPSDSNGDIIIGGRASIGSYIRFTITDETGTLDLRSEIFSAQKNLVKDNYWYIQYPFKKGKSYIVSNIGTGSAYAYLANTIPTTTEPNLQEINDGKDFKGSITFVAENDYSVIRGYCSESTVFSVGAANGIESRIQKLETRETLQALLEKEFVRGSLSESGNASYETYDTIVLKGYYDVSKLGVIEFETSSDIRQRISFFDKDFKKLSCSSWQNKERWDIPTNAKYCKVGLRPYENNAVKHSASDIISTNVACEVKSNLIEVVDVSNAKGITSSTFAVAHNTPSVSQLTIVAKAETSATLKITYYTRTKSFVYCSNCNIGDKRETINLLLPPIMYDGNACEIRIEGNCYIEQLVLNPINVQSQDNHIRVSAHLGYRLYFPENTKLSYKMAAMCGMWGSVANVHETADGGLICYHQNDARLSEDGVNVISLSAEEINSKTTAEMTSYNAGIYMSPYYTDENVPTFDEYCQIMAQGNMHPILSINGITENLFAKIKEVLDKYGLTNKTTIRSYSTSILQKAYSVFSDTIRYLYDCGEFTESKVEYWDGLNFGNAEKMVGYDWMHYGSEVDIDAAINFAFSKGMMIMPDAKDNYELFKKLINKGVREFTVNHFISANML